MTETAEPLRQTQLLGRLVIDYDTTEAVGHVDRLLVDPKSHQVEGLVCKSGFLGRNKRPIAWVQMQTIGKDSILVRLQGSAGTEHLAEAQSMVGLEVWSDAGDRVGYLVDYCINRESGAITAYWFSKEGLQSITEGVYSLSPSSIISAGRKRVMVADQAVVVADRVIDGLEQQAGDAAEFLKQDYAQTQQDWQSAVDSTQAIAEQLQNQTQKLAEKAKAQFSGTQSQLQEKRQALKGRFRQTFSQVKGRFQQIGESSDRPWQTSNADQTIDITPLESWTEESEDEDRTEPLQ
ncbi:MAG: PRC-barrel domain-containing protein [Almyronema sp.]